MQVPKVVALNFEGEVCFIQETAKRFVKSFNVELLVLEFGLGADIVENVHESLDRHSYDGKGTYECEDARDHREILLAPSKIESIVNLSDRECLKELFGTAPRFSPSSAACTSTPMAA